MVVTNSGPLNYEKRGIEFESAMLLWEDPNRVVIQAPHPIENRYILIAEFQDKLWTAIYTYRNTLIRIISVRLARKKERKLYRK